MKDCEALAEELMGEMRALHRAKPQKHLNEAFSGEAFILDYLANTDGTAQPSTIGGEMGVSSARVATALNSLEKKGLVRRHIDTNDRRRILIELTEQGRATARHHHEAVRRVVSRMLDLLGEDDAREYIRINKRLAQMLPACEEMTEG